MYILSANGREGEQTMRYKTVAEFGAYAVIEPTEPVKRIEAINVSRKPKPVEAQEHKRISNKRRKKHEKELNISAYMAMVVPVLSVVGMFAWWLVMGY